MGCFGAQKTPITEKQNFTSKTKVYDFCSILNPYQQIILTHPSTQILIGFGPIFLNKKKLFYPLA